MRGRIGRRVRDDVCPRSGQRLARGHVMMDAPMDVRDACRPVIVMRRPPSRPAPLPSVRHFDGCGARPSRAHGQATSSPLYLCASRLPALHDAPEDSGGLGRGGRRREMILFYVYRLSLSLSLCDMTHVSLCSYDVLHLRIPTAYRLQLYTWAGATVLTEICSVLVRVSVGPDSA